MMMNNITPNNGKISRSGIGTLSENNLHAALIQWVSKTGDKFEENIDGYIIDIMRGDLIIEVQIKKFNALKEKIQHLCLSHKFQIIHPIYKHKWIIKEEADGEIISQRKSPKRGRVEELFGELIRTPTILMQTNLSICVLLVDINEIWRNDGRGSWRRKNWSIADRTLIDVHEKYEFHQPNDFLHLLPPTLPDPFTNNDIATNLGISKSLAGKMTYCLRKMDQVKIIGKQGRAYIMAVK